MFFNTRILKPLFMALFIAGTVFFAAAQERGDVRLTHRFSWTDDPYALRYEVLVEQEIDGVFSSFLRESTYQAYMLASLPPGIFRLRVIPFDIRDIAATGTPWRYFRVVALQIQDPQLVADGSPPQEPQLVVEDIPQPREDLTAADEQPLQPAFAVSEPPPIERQPPRANWFSLEATALGAGLRYERMLSGRIFAGGNIFINNAMGDIEYAINASNYTRMIAAANATVRFFPVPVFYIGLGLGFGLYNPGFGIYDFVGEGPWTGGFSFTPELGVRWDPGRPGGFFINPFVAVPFVIGIGTNMDVRLGFGLGWAWGAAGRR